MPFDAKSEASRAVAKRLREDEIAWLVTVTNGTPRPVPVWFLWDGDQSVIVYSEPGALKAKTIETNPRASLHFNSDEHGGDVAILYGTVERDAAAPSMLQNEPYMKKYDAALKRYVAENGSTPERVSADFNAVLRFTIDDARSW